jgi:hypothetical protein
MLDELTTFTSNTLPIPNTFHTCSYGNTCQCIRCATHPYNAATQNYVRSTFDLAHKPSTSTTSTDPLGAHANGNGHRHSNGEEHSPPVVETPSNSSVVEEQTLPALDYFFINYAFPSDSCGGNTNSCPCGDNCECIGCMFHRFDELTMALPLDP